MGGGVIVSGPAAGGVTALRVTGSVTVQDRGRPGFADIGVSGSGAADRGAAELANRLVGNEPAAAVLELVLGEVALRVDGATLIALTGAPGPIRVDGDPKPYAEPFWVPAHATVEVSYPPTGLRSYLALAGGIAVPPVLGSRSTDTLSGLGPPPVRCGDVLPIGPRRGTPAPPGPAVAPPPGPVALAVSPGPRGDWFTAESMRVLTDSAWVVHPASDRVGVRLSGPRLRRSRDGELPSEGMVRGGIQVPSGGQPIVFGADHPTTGGYPVLAVVTDADCDRLAQCRPGQVVRFHRVRPPA